MQFPRLLFCLPPQPRQVRMGLRSGPYGLGLSGSRLRGRHSGACGESLRRERGDCFPGRNTPPSRGGGRGLGRWSEDLVRRPSASSQIPFLLLSSQKCVTRGCRILRGSCRFIPWLLHFHRFFSIFIKTSRPYTRPPAREVNVYTVPSLLSNKPQRVSS